MTAFISYAQSTARDLADRFTSILRARGVAVWMDRLCLRGGDQIDSQIIQAIADCELFVVIVDRGYLASKYCQSELEIACGRRMRTAALPKLVLVQVGAASFDENPHAILLKLMLHLHAPGGASEAAHLFEAWADAEFGPAGLPPERVIPELPSREGRFVLAGRGPYLGVWPVTHAVIPGAAGYPDVPLVGLTVRAAVDLANRLSERAGLEPVYEVRRRVVRWAEGRTGVRLPTTTEYTPSRRRGGPPPYLPAVLAGLAPDPRTGLVTPTGHTHWLWELEDGRELDVDASFPLSDGRNANGTVADPDFGIGLRLAVDVERRSR